MGGIRLRVLGQGLGSQALGCALFAVHGAHDAQVLSTLIFLGVTKLFLKCLNNLAIKSTPREPLARRLP